MHLNMNKLEELYHPSQKFDDKRVYELISSGGTLGIFQLESGLLKSYSKKLKPTCLEDLSALVAIVRPGCLEIISQETGDNMAVSFCKRRNGLENITYEFPTLEPHLKSTYGIIVYQEQILEIVKDIAGFNLQEADSLRKACGKKLPEEMVKVQTIFIEGCKKTGKVNEKDAEAIWEWIKKSQRYLFNKSHSLSYAVLAYISAYLKVDNPKKFYISWLKHAKDKANPFEEIKNLVNDAKANGFDITTPRLYLENEQFHCFHENGRDFIAFGLSDIRGVGTQQFSKLKLTLETLKTIIGVEVKSWTWDSFAISALSILGYGTFKSLANSGALDYFNVDRQRMLYEYSNYKEFLTENDIKYIRENLNKNILETIKTIIPTTKINNRKISAKKFFQFRSLISILENPPFSLKDSIDFISFNEELYLGTGVTCTKVDGCDASSANCTVIDLVKGNVGEYICVACQIDSARPYSIKKGKNKGGEMCFLNISDSSAAMDSAVAFVESYKEFKNILIEKNTVLLRGKYNKDKNSFVVEKAWQI